MSEQPETNDLSVNPENKTKKRSRFNLRWIYKQMKAALSIIAMVLLIGLVGMIVSFFYKELTDEGYIIEQVNVPDSMVEAGFSGPLIANRISYELQNIMGFTRQQEYSKNYSSSGSDNDLSIELIGIGVPVRGIIDLIGDAIGVNRRKRIKADIYFAGPKVVMILKFSGEKPEYMEANYDLNLDVPMKELISKAAENILKYTDDESLQRYYLNYTYNGEGSVQLAKYRLEKYAGDRRKEAIILADWAMALIRMKNFDLADVKLEEGLNKDSTVAQIHLTRGTWYMMQNKSDEALPNFDRALKSFTPQDRIMDKLRVFNNIGIVYQQKKKVDSALYYYKKAIEIDSKFNIAYINIGYLYLEEKKDTAIFLEYLDKSLRYGLPIYTLEKNTAQEQLEALRKLQAFKDILRKYAE